MNTQVLKDAQAAGIELGAELEQELAETTETLQSTIQEPAFKEPVAVPKQDEAPAEQTASDDVDSDLAWLDLPEDLGVESVADAPEIPDTPEAKKFAEDFKQYMGFDVDELRDGMKEFKRMNEEIVAYRNEKALKQQLNQVKSKWGIDDTAFDARMNQVVERFNKYPPEMKAKLDNPEGIELIWAKIQQEQQSQVARPNVPQFERSRSVAPSANGRPKPMFSRSQILAMDEATYAQHASDITYAYTNGLVSQE